MSALPYEPPPLIVSDQKHRFALLLWARDKAAQALDAALSVPRAARSYLTRVLGALVVGQRLRTLLGVTTMAWRWLTAHLSPLGLLAAGVTLVGTGTGQRLLGRVLAPVGRAARTITGKALGLVDSGLRWLGKPGARIADGLQRLRTRARQLLPLLAAGLQTVRALLTPVLAPVSALAGLAVTVLTKVTLRALIPLKALHVAAGALLALLLGIQAPTVSQSAGSSSPAAPSTPAKPDPASPMVMPAWEPDVPTPGNRAERRAAQRKTRPTAA